MAFPTVVATNSGNSSFVGTSVPVNLPSGIQAGDLLLVFFAQRSTVEVTWPAGWTEVFAGVNSPNSETRLECAYRLADGTEGATIMVTAANARSAHTSYRIAGWNGTTAPEAATSTGADATPDPPSLATSWGTADTLWLVGLGISVETASPSISAFPGAYTDEFSALFGGGGNCRAGSARRQRRTATENPSAGVLSSADDWVAATVAIRPYDASVTDWAYNLLAIDSIDDTNVTVKVNVSTASATGGAKAKIALKVGKP